MPEQADWFGSLTIEEAWAWVAGSVAAVVAVVAALRKGWPAFKRFVDFLTRGIRLVDTLTSLPDELAAIRHELQHNGGGSTKDAVIRTELAVTDLAAEVAHVKRQAASLKTRSDRTNRTLREHIANSAHEERGAA